MEIVQHPPVGQSLTLSLKGRLDGAWSEHTQAALTRAIENGHHHLVLDFSEVAFVSSAGIRVILMSYKQLAKIKGSLKIVSPQREVLSLLEMSGLGKIVTIETEAQHAETAATPAPKAPEVERLEHEGIVAERYPLGDGVAPVHAIGAASPLRPCLPPERVQFQPESFGLGFGAIGTHETQEKDCRERLGEFLALGGAVLAQPADGTQSTDYLVSQGTLVPEITVTSGLWSPGGFTSLLRFEAADKVPLSRLIGLALKSVGSRPVGFVMVAETQHLIGVSLIRQPDPQQGVRFDFPEIRENLLFTAEPAWPRSLALVVGFATPSAADTPTALAPLLRPVHPTLEYQVHVHAAAFPYNPLPKGVITLQETVRSLLDTERALGLLHLINDWRTPGGAGESLFLRGALWTTPLAC